MIYEKFDTSRLERVNKKVSTAKASSLFSLAGYLLYEGKAVARLVWRRGENVSISPVEGVDFTQVTESINQAMDELLYAEAWLHEVSPSRNLSASPPNAEDLLRFVIVTQFDRQNWSHLAQQTILQRVASAAGEASWPPRQTRIKPTLAPYTEENVARLLKEKAEDNDFFGIVNREPGYDTNPLPADKAEFEHWRYTCSRKKDLTFFLVDEEGVPTVKQLNRTYSSGTAEYIQGAFGDSLLEIINIRYLMPSPTAGEEKNTGKKDMIPVKFVPFLNDDGEVRWQATHERTGKSLIDSVFEKPIDGRKKLEKQGYRLFRYGSTAAIKESKEVGVELSI